MGSIYLRDALIDPSPASREAYVAELIQTGQNVDRVMSAYRPLVASTEEQEPWDRLQAELIDYRQSREVALTEDARRHPRRGCRPASGAVGAGA